MIQVSKLYIYSRRSSHNNDHRIKKCAQLFQIKGTPQVFWRVGAGNIFPRFVYNLMNIWANMLCANFQFIPSFHFSRIIIFIAQNDKNWKAFTQIRIRIAQKIDFQFSSQYISLLSFVVCTILRAIFLRFSNFMLLAVQFL
jgi:hypothetical protein